MYQYIMNRTNSNLNKRWGTLSDGNRESIAYWDPSSDEDLTVMIWQFSHVPIRATNHWKREQDWFELWWTVQIWNETVSEWDNEEDTVYRGDWDWRGHWLSNCPIRIKFCHQNNYSFFHLEKNKNPQPQLHKCNRSGEKMKILLLRASD